MYNVYIERRTVFRVYIPLNIISLASANFSVPELEEITDF